MMLTEEFLLQWLGATDDSLLNIARVMVGQEKKEALLKDEGSDKDYGFSFQGVDALKRACLVEVREMFEKTGTKPVVADIGAGFGAMTWKLLAAGAQTDAFELQAASAKELMSRMESRDKRLWQGMELKDILKVFSGNALAILQAPEFKEKYDFIWISQVIHFMNPEEIKQLNEIFKQILKPGGKVFVMSNSLHIFDHVDEKKLVQKSYQDAVSKGVYCPGFLTTNVASVKETGQVTVLTTYNQIEMQNKGLEAVANAYKVGYAGPNSKEVIKAFKKNLTSYKGSPLTVSTFHNVINLFDPETLKLVFKQSGFEVKSFYFSSDKDIKSAGKPTNAVIALMQKPMPEPDFQSTLKRSSSFFKPELKEWIKLTIEEVENHVVKQKLREAFNVKDYSHLLNLSCAFCLPGLVKRLLKNKEELKVNIDCRDLTNGNTALDWALAITPDSEEKYLIIKMLEANQAQRQSDLPTSHLDVAEPSIAS